MQTPTEISISSLAARYYVNKGWDLETLNKYLVKGSFVEKCGVSDDDQYYLLDAGSSIDVDKLLGDFPDIKIHAWWPEDRKLSKRAVLVAKNWRVTSFSG